MTWVAVAVGGALGSMAGVSRLGYWPVASLFVQLRRGLIADLCSWRVIVKRSLESVRDFVQLGSTSAMSFERGEVDGFSLGVKPSANHFRPPASTG
jgi:hypothetical protein